MTRQEIFDTALNGIRKQGEPAYYGRVCVYYDTTNGNKCAAGQLLSDEAAYELSQTGMGTWFKDIYEDTYAIIEAIDIPDYLTDEDNRKFIQDIQACHDTSANAPSSKSFMAVFEKMMESFARRYGLVYTPKS